MVWLAIILEIFQTQKVLEAVKIGLRHSASSMDTLWWTIFTQRITQCAFCLLQTKMGALPTAGSTLTWPGGHPIGCQWNLKQATAWTEVYRRQDKGRWLEENKCGWKGLWKLPKRSKLNLNAFLMVLDALTLAFPHPTATVLRVTGLWNVKNCRADYACGVIHYLVKLGFSGTDRTPWMRACAVFALWWLSTAWVLGLHDPASE